VPAQTPVARIFYQRRMAVANGGVTASTELIAAKRHVGVSHP